jgi:hypothetical protein
MQLGQLEARRLAAGSLVAQHQAALSEWASDIGLNRRLEGWIPQGKDANGCYVDVPSCPRAGPAAGLAPLAGVGRWEAVGEQPDELAEGWFPLLQLVANPAVPESDATGATIFFGLVPTGSADVDKFGTARFDDATSYEIRCFVRRHKPACPRTGPQCHCPIVWSDPTESYMLASHFDLQGTANRPVTVQLPDLNALQSDALTLPLGSAGGLIMKAPQSLMPTATFPPGGSFGLPNEICTFAIPLITIVATFVFKLFLPVVILIFQLWFMLLLKFCIPVNLDANLAGALQALPPDQSVGPNFELQFGATLDGEIDDLMSGADLGNGKASQVLKNSPQPTDRIRLAKMMLSGPISPVPPSDLIFAPHVDRSTVVP